jgi:hypothetical protein
MSDDPDLQRLLPEQTERKGSSPRVLAAALVALRNIADGHGDPRALAQAVLDMKAAEPDQPDTVVPSAAGIRPAVGDRVAWTRAFFANPLLARLLVAAAIIFVLYRAWSTGCFFSAACLASN